MTSLTRDDVKTLFSRLNEMAQSQKQYLIELDAGDGRW